ncbi:MAG: hypothetical protein KU38_07890 [Sulfurovum sp. FS08-3]|nr:MAG: hypothetical protein KU38_07890 [Sulfurovum sp. FS08-3]
MEGGGINHVDELFTEFTLVQNELDKYNNFWYIWELFEDKIVEICQSRNNYNTNQVVQAYLFALNPHNIIWEKGSKDWHTLKPQNQRFFKRMAKEIGHCPSTLYSIAKLLTSVGSSYLSDGIGWIANMLRKNRNLWSDPLEYDTVYYIETLMRKYIFENSQKIKKEQKAKEDVIEILNFLIEKGLAMGYMLRERVL